MIELLNENRGNRFNRMLIKHLMPVIQLNWFVEIDCTFTNYLICGTFVCSFAECNVEYVMYSISHNLIAPKFIFKFILR